MQLDILKELGLDVGEIKIYQALLENGQLSAGEIIKRTNLKRGDCYNKIYHLKKRDLLKEIKKKSKKYFLLEHPDRITQLMKKRINEFLTVQRTLESIIPDITSQYNLISDKPGVIFYEGFEGIKTIYSDILREVENGGEYQLIRAKYEGIYQQKIVSNIVEGFVKKRAKKKICVQALTPYEEIFRKENSQERIRKDQKIILDRQWVLMEDYNAPVEIDIYKDKVAFLSFKRELLGAVIESPQIAQAMKQLFILSREGAKIRFERKSEHITREHKNI